MFQNFMQDAINEAIVAIDSGEIPVGCVIVDKDSNIIARSHNKTKESPVMHAEMLAINQAMQTMDNNLRECSMYVTVEPCMMCAYAISLAKIKNLYIGTIEPKTGAIMTRTKVFQMPICNHKPNVYYGFDETKCKDLMQKFFQDKR